MNQSTWREKVEQVFARKALSTLTSTMFSAFSSLDPLDFLNRQKTILVPRAQPWRTEVALNFDKPQLLYMLV